MPTHSGLNDRQRRFCEEFLIDLCASAAAKRAGYSPATAESQGSRLLGNVEVQAAIQAAMQRRSERTSITADRVLQELARIAFSDLREVLTWGPESVTLKDSGELDDDAAATVAEVSQTVTKAGQTIRLKLHSKMDALDKLARHLGLFADLGRPVDPLEAAEQMKSALHEMMRLSSGLPFPDPAGGNGDAQAEDAADDEPDEP